jgi:O-antigen/teichoic acid export membrane protein
MTRTVSLGALRERIKNTHPRTRKAQLNTLFGLVLKGGGMFISLLLVPMTIDYLSKDTYGTWLTISSMVTMISFFDIGIGNGLRNKLSEAISNKDILLARAYISTAYLIFGLVQFVFVTLFLLFFRFIPWQRILNTSINNDQLQVVVLVTAIGIAIKLVLDILSFSLLSFQESAKVNVINFVSNLIILIGTYVITLFTKGNLLYLGILTAVSPIAVLLVAGGILYRGQLAAYRPSLKFANKKYAKSLLSLGYKFFVIQMAIIVLFYSDNLIITQIFGPSEVTIYNVSFRYFNAITTIFAIIIAPYWSAFTEASVKNDVEWMKKTYKYLQFLWMGLVVLVILMVLVAEPVYSMWVGNRVKVPLSLNICMGIFVIVSGWNSVTNLVINGIGTIRLQLYTTSISAALNVPVAIYLGKQLHMGSSGVILATTVCLLMGSVLGGMQAHKLVNRTAVGIWNA